LFEVESWLGSFSDSEVFDTYGAHLIFPQQPTAKLDQNRVRFYEDYLKSGALLTVLAIGRIESKTPIGRAHKTVEIRKNNDHSTSAVWKGTSVLQILYSFICDGHHKMAAAANLNKPIFILTFLDRSPGGMGTGVFDSKGVDDLFYEFSRNNLFSRPLSEGKFFTEIAIPPPSIQDTSSLRLVFCNLGLEQLSFDELNIFLSELAIEPKSISFPMDGKAGYAVLEFDNEVEWHAALGRSWCSFRRQSGFFSVMVYPVGMNHLRNGVCALSFLLATSN